VYAAGTMSSDCFLELEAYGHCALATCTYQLSRLRRHNTPRHVIRRWGFMTACLYPNYETRALVPHSTSRPSGLLVLGQDLYSDLLGTARHAIDETVWNTIGLYRLLDFD
jgi:hypothetical protein